MELRVYLDKLQVEEVIHEPVYTYVTIMGQFLLASSDTSVKAVRSFVIDRTYREHTVTY